MSEAYVLRARSAVRKRGVFVKICRAEEWAFCCATPKHKNEESTDMNAAAKTALLNRNVAKSEPNLLIADDASPDECRAR
jgi:SRSO17 transposase